MSQLQTGRRQVEPAVEGVAPERLDDLVHAIAQAPSELSAEIACPPADARRLALLARAYGVQGRVSVRAVADTNAQTWTVRGPGGRRGSHDRRGRSGSLAEVVAGLAAPAPCAAHRVRDGMIRGQRVALVTNLPARYRMPLFSGLAERLAEEDAELRVFFLSRGAAARAWLQDGSPLGFAHEWVWSVPLPIRRRPPFLPLDLHRRLRRYAPTILVSAGFSPWVSGRAARFARSRRIPFGLWSGEIHGMGTAESHARRRQRAGLARRADFGIAYGSLSARYLNDLAPQLPVVLGRNTSVDGAWPARAGSAGRIELLAVGDLASSRKGMDVLVDALRLAPELDCRLAIVGDGLKRSALERRASGDDRIFFLGPLAGQALEAAYAASNVFLFPSRADVFGLVLVEAMAHGLATVVSAAPGAVADLAVPDRNCLVIESHAPEAWMQAIRRLVDDSALRTRLGEEAWRTVAQRWTIGHAVEAMVAGVRLGTMVGRR